MKQLLIFMFAAALSCPASGQKNITSQPQYWLRYTANFQFPSKTNLTVEGESRRFFKEKGFAAALFRSQLQVPLQHDFSFDVAAACFYFYGQHFSEAELETRPSYLDIRIHQSLLKRHAFGKWSLTNRIRLEERIVQLEKAQGNNSFKVFPRLRMGILFQYSLSENWELRGSNDVIFNVFQKETPNVFDRNNFSLGMFRRLSAHSGIEVGYMNQFIQRAGLAEYQRRDIMRVFFIQNFSVKKREVGKP